MRKIESSSIIPIIVICAILMVLALILSYAIFPTTSVTTTSGTHISTLSLPSGATNIIDLGNNWITFDVPINDRTFVLLYRYIVVDRGPSEPMTLLGIRQKDGSIQK